MICLKIRTFVVSATTSSRSRLVFWCCDLLENSYLCGISNNRSQASLVFYRVVICLKIRTFVVSATTRFLFSLMRLRLWFAWKFVPLWYQQQLFTCKKFFCYCCDLLENSYLCGISNNLRHQGNNQDLVVICLKIRTFVVSATTLFNLASFCECCDLLENSYLCGISNNSILYHVSVGLVVICLKIRTFVVSATTINWLCDIMGWLWFAWKFVPLWYQQQPNFILQLFNTVVICLKIRTFVVSATTQTHTYRFSWMLWFAWKFVPLWYQQQLRLKYPICGYCCDLLENSYLCGISNNSCDCASFNNFVVICLKIRTFVVSATTACNLFSELPELWFAWKFVPLWYQQQRVGAYLSKYACCDLLENSYLCGISNNASHRNTTGRTVVICLKIRTFVVSATTCG